MYSLFMMLVEMYSIANDPSSTDEQLKHVLKDTQRITAEYYVRLLVCRRKNLSPTVFDYILNMYSRDKDVHMELVRHSCLTESAAIKFAKSQSIDIVFHLSSNPSISHEASEIVYKRLHNPKDRMHKSSYMILSRLLNNPNFSPEIKMFLDLSQ